MKPLLKTPITRDRKAVGDWVSAAEQATDAGRNDFAERQKRRIADAQSTREEAARVVRTIRKAGK